MPDKDGRVLNFLFINRNPKIKDWNFYKPFMP